MKETPILFSAPMVRAILAGTKTQTRRVITNKTALEWLKPGVFAPEFVADPGNYLCRYGYAGDRLWVRETWCQPDPTQRDALYRADCDAAQLEMEREVRREVGAGAYAPWRPSIFMPRWASRLTLEIAELRAQRLQDISDADAQAEGVEPAGGFMATSGCWTNYDSDGPSLASARESYRTLWDSINGKRPGCAWQDNPWVWAITFKRVEQTTNAEAAQ